MYINFEDPLAFLALAKSLGGVKAQGKNAPVKLTEASVTKAFDTLLAAPREADSKWLNKTFPPASTASWKPWDMLEQGQMAGMLTTLSDYKLNTKDRAGIVMAGLPFPKGETIWKSSWLNGRSFVISSRTAFSREAFEWIKEMTSPTSNVKFWNEAYKLPSIMNSYLIGGIKNDASVQSVVSFLDKDEAVSKGPAHSKQLQQLENGLHRLWKGEINWKTFSEQLEQQWGSGTAAGSASPSASPPPAASSTAVSTATPGSTPIPNPAS
jgi:multiple sugar transport system substrate-binding protein